MLIVLPDVGTVFTIRLPKKQYTVTYNHDKLNTDVSDEFHTKNRLFMMKLPGKTVERLSEYRRTLLECLNEKRNFIFSHDLAARLHITAVQVRRDLMLIGYSSVLRKGYDVRELIDTIGKIIDSDESHECGCYWYRKPWKSCCRLF